MPICSCFFWYATHSLVTSGRQAIPTKGTASTGRGEMEPPHPLSPFTPLLAKGLENNPVRPKLRDSVSSPCSTPPYHFFAARRARLGRCYALQLVTHATSWHLQPGADMRRDPMGRNNRTNPAARARDTTVDLLSGQRPWLASPSLLPWPSRMIQNHYHRYHRPTVRSRTPRAGNT